MLDIIDFCKISSTTSMRKNTPNDDCIKLQLIIFVINAKNVQRAKLNVAYVYNRRKYTVNTIIMLAHTNTCSN